MSHQDLTELVKELEKLSRILEERKKRLETAASVMREIETFLQNLAQQSARPDPYEVTWPSDSDQDQVAGALGCSVDPWTPWSL